ncbi:MAG TPA: hypothetical protein VG733_09640 [Chthoniobacteraceae bacterium]|nr:hypothetical protein [Chthoniobacteraceae bacterium]
MDDEPDPKILDWLGNDARGVPYYLCPLNLGWSEAGAARDLEIFRRAAARLAEEPAYWAEIIRTANWRHSLAGCACLLASRTRGFFDDLCFRFNAGSFVSPQIAVTLGLLHGAKAAAFFESALNNAQLRPKELASAHRVLLCMGERPPREIVADTWSGLDRDDAITGDAVAAEQWDFWKGVVEGN